MSEKLVGVDGMEFMGKRTKITPDGKIKFNCFEIRCCDCPWVKDIGERLACNYQGRLGKGQKTLTGETLK